MGDSLLMCDGVSFADALASKASVPGGGGAAAYTGALGIALGSMVGNLTVGKKKYAAYEDDIVRLLTEADAVRARLIALVQEDAEAFAPLSEAYAIPREDPARAAILEERTLNALEPPLQMMREVCHAIQILEELAEKGSRLVVSDAGCGAALCGGALQAAALNVFVNTKTLTEKHVAQRVNEECQQMLDEYVPRAAAVVATVMEVLQPSAE